MPRQSILRTPKRLVRVSEFQSPPSSCLRALRRLHPRLELVCLTPGVWWIGEVNRTSRAILSGQARRAMLLDKLHRGGAVRALSFWKAELMAQGFRMLAMVTTPQPTPTQCYAAVAPTLRVTARQVDAALDYAIAESSGVHKREATNKWLREEYAPHMGKDAYRHAYHRPIYSLPGATP